MDATARPGELSNLATLTGQVTDIYDRLLTFPQLWGEVQLAAGQKKSASPPSLDDPLPPDSSVRAEVALAENKAVAPPRLALVGEFSTGKSTLLNAILHSAASNKVFALLGLKDTLLPTAEQVCTGNITEMEFTGEELPDPLPEDAEGRAALANLFEFSVTFLNEAEVKGLLLSFSERLKLGLTEQSLRAADWYEQLKHLLLPIKTRYEERQGDDLARKDLRVLWEVIEAVRNPAFRALLSNKKDQPIGRGKEGLDAFKKLLQRPALDPVPATWAEVESKLADIRKKPDEFSLERFNLVKFLRFRMPHPEFVKCKFSLFDFPGLGAGLHRDEFIGRDFIAEANVIMVLSRPGRVGGASVNYILSSFSNRRKKLTVRDLLRRVYFILNGQPIEPPREENDKRERIAPVKFYRNFLQTVRNLLGPLLNRQELSPEERKELLLMGLTHFLACDGKLSGHLRFGTNDDTINVLRGEYETRRDKGFFDCPTDAQTLRDLSASAVLRSESDGYPLLAEQLADPIAGKVIAGVFEPLNKEAGMPNLLATIRRFVREEGPSIQQEDVRMHLERAVSPLAVLQNFAPPRVPEGLASLPVHDMKRRFDEAVQKERDWGDVLDAWATGSREAILGRPALVDALRQLEDEEAAVIRRIEDKAAELISAPTLGRFRQPLEALSDSFENWLHARGEAGPVGSDEVGGMFDVFMDKPDGDGAALLRLDHPLLLYRYAMQQRGEMLAWFYRDLFGPFLDGCVRICDKSSDGAWAPVNQVWARVVQCAETGGNHPQHARLRDFRKLAGDLDTALMSMRGWMDKPDWVIRKKLRALLPPDQAEACAGPFFDGDVARGQKVRLRPLPFRGPVPATSRQLSVLLTRLNFLGTETALATLSEPHVPELARGSVVQVLQAVGLVDQAAREEQLTFAEADADFWKQPLPALTGKLVETDGTLFWSPLPFDPLGKKFDFQGVETFLTAIRQHLVLMFGDLAVKMTRLLKERWKAFHSREWLPGLQKMAEPTSKFPLWGWLNEHSHLVLERNPVEDRLKELEGRIRDLQRMGLFR